LQVDKDQNAIISLIINYWQINFSIQLWKVR